MLSAGIDVGTLWTKAVVIGNNTILGWSMSLTGEDCDQVARHTLVDALGSCGASIGDLHTIIATGAGKGEVSFAHDQATDIVCLARGIRFLHPEARGAIDMGGESTMVVKLDENGQIVDYARNDKCAAGTGIFLDAMGKVMGVAVEDMGPLSLKSTSEVDITSTCVVFAESEVGVAGPPKGAQGGHPEGRAQVYCSPGVRVGEPLRDERPQHCRRWTGKKPGNTLLP